MDTDEIKRRWLLANEQLRDSSEDDIFPPDFSLGKKKTALMRLANRYKRFHYLSLIMAAASLIWTGSPLFPGKYKIALCIYMVAYFLICSLVDWWLYMQISSIDVLRMQTMTVIKKTMNCRKRHLQSILFLIPLALGLMALYFFSFGGDEYILFGILGGFIIGLVIGLRQLSEFLNDYKAINPSEE